MDGVKPQQRDNTGGSTVRRPVEHARPAIREHHKPQPDRPKRQSGEMYWLVRSLGKTAAKRKNTLVNRFKATEFAKWPTKSKIRRIYVVLTLVLFIVSTIIGIIEPLIGDRPYNVSTSARAILPKPSEQLSKFLKFDAKESKFAYNAGYSPNTKSDNGMDSTGNPRYTASFAKEPTKGVTVTDPGNSIDFTMKPKFSLGVGKQDKNQMFYALGKTDGFLVYTNQVASVKEDIVLGQKPTKDKMTFDYDLDLGDGLEAKLEKDGSIGVYGSDLPINGNVATGSDKDAQLLQQAKKNAPKTKFLFGIPAPFVKEAGKKQSTVDVRYELNGNKLRLVADRLKSAAYPLTIDPSIFVETAAQLMRGNNESNVEFDLTTEQFKKGSTTGARIDEWTETGEMNDPEYLEGPVPL